MPPRVAERKAPPRLLVAFFYLLLPVLKPILKKTLRRNKWIWRRFQAARDRLVETSPLAVGLEAHFTRRLYAGSFYLFGPALRVVLKRTLGWNTWIWGKLQAAHRRLMQGSSRPTGLPDVRPADGRPRPFGVNVAGYLNSETGTGKIARSTTQVLKDANIPYVLNNVIGPGSINKDTTHREFSNRNPYALNLIYVNPDQAANFAWDKGVAYFQDRYNIGVWNWELANFPEGWLHRFQYYNEIWVPTNFVLDALSRVSPVPMLRMPYPIQPEPRRCDDLERSRFGLSSESFFFLFVFDFHSIFERKNPLGLIQAFKRAFSKDEDVVLVIKSSHADPQAIRTMREAAKQANVKIINTVLSREEVNTLYYLCDCYVSLHRSEGFGLTPAEAMCAGKPVIATAYGGNVDFMTSENSYLAKYKLIEIDRDYHPYLKGFVWADPDLDHAAELMRHVYENREEAKNIGRKAREDVLRLLHPRIVGDLIKQRLLTALLKGSATPNLEAAVDQATAMEIKKAT